MVFGHLDIRFDARVLEPRPWTVRQSAWAAELLQDAPPGRVLELFCGVGHIGMLANTAQTRDLVLVDVDPVACELAAVNAEANGQLAEIRCGRIDEVLDPGERFAVVIADPPWVPSIQTDRHPGDPVLAIDGGDDGLDLARTCVATIAAHLIDGGSAVLQLGSAQQYDSITGHLRARPELGLRVIEAREQPGRGVLMCLQRAPDRKDHP